MSTPEDYSEYVSELRERVCSRCIARQPGSPPCAPRGIACGIELHVPKLVQLCRSTDSALMNTYIDRLHDEICADCQYRTAPVCPCPLDYLLELAVEAVEAVESRRARRRPKTTAS
jgi:hypothetical protein